MAGKADFTEDEWKELQQGVTGAGLLVSTAHRDFTDAFGEASTVAKQLAAHRESESQLVRELSGTRGTGFGLVAQPKEVVEETINALGAAAEVLGQRAPDELEAYRGLVLDVATAVAEAKGGVKDEEKEAIDRITAALGAVQHHCLTSVHAVLGTLAEVAARELGQLSLIDPLSLVLLYARVGSLKFEPAALRWLARLAAGDGDDPSAGGRA